MTPDLSKKTILGAVPRQISADQADDRDYLIIDVRSPEEFCDGSIPGAVNIPLFAGEERAEIGTIYRHGGRNRAIEEGYAIVDGKLDHLLSDFEPYRGRKVAVFCARGGMRSLSVVNLLTQCGYDAWQIEGGYKRYRHEVLDRLGKFAPPLIVIHGLTGTGKTRILQQLAPAIDLEALARHRSSLFGALDRSPHNQKQFESALAQVIRGLADPPYFIEGESRKIGQVFIPKALAQAMRQGLLVKVHCSLETRVARIIDDYPVTDEKVLDKVDQVLQTLTRRLGGTRVAQMRQLLHNGQLEPLVRALLVDYYDARYSKAMHRYTYALELSSENIVEAAERLRRFRTSL